jgi:hypothetical protein
MRNGSSQNGCICRASFSQAGHLAAYDYAALIRIDAVEG